MAGVEHDTINIDDEAEILNIRPTSHIGEKVRSYTVKFKIEAVEYAEKNSISAAAKKYNVDRKTIREWKEKKADIVALVKRAGKSRKRLDGAGRKPLSEVLEERIVSWITDRRDKRLRVSRKLIMKKAKLLYLDMKEDHALVHGGDFVASKGWLENFMKRHGLSLRRKTSIAQKDPDQLIGKLVAYVLRVRKLRETFEYHASDIIAFDETPVWFDMVSSNTVEKKGAKDVTLKSTGHEKSRVTVGLAAKGDGTKLKPFIVFKNAKREVASLQKEFKSRCVIASTPNGWMDTEQTLRWCDDVIGRFSFRRRLLAWDTYECHLVDLVTKSLTMKKVDTAYIPGGATRYIQAPDVSWNKPFKSHCAEQYDKWLEEEGIHTETEAGNLKAPPRKRVVEWILHAWDQLSKELIKKSFLTCGLTNAIDGSEDTEIHCFKPGQPCEKGRAVLSEQLKLLSTEEINPFIPDDNDIAASTPDNIVLDIDHDSDEDIEID